MAGMNHYARLEVPRDASPEDIRAAYFDAARRLHPDTNPDPDAKDQFIAIQESYEVLSNAERRLSYDATLPPHEISGPAISFSVQYSRSSLPSSPEPQLVYALLELTSIPDPTPDTPPPLNLCLVLDRSTSMQGSRMDMVKSNATQLLRQMKPQDFISIVTFSDRAEVLIPATRVTDLPRLESKISMLQTGGGTEIHHGLEVGLAQIRRNMSSSFINHLILLTDGRTYGDESGCIELAEQAGQEGIGISGIGIGNDWNDHFLDQISILGGGTSMFVTTPKDLHQYLIQKYTHLSKVYAKQVTLDFDTGPGVDLRYAFRLQPEVGLLSPKSPIRAGNIPQFASLSILMEFFVRDIAPNLDSLCLASGRIKMDIPGRFIPTTKIGLDMSRPVSHTSEPESPPHQIIQAMSHLTLYRIQDRARQEVSDGEISKASYHLQSLATSLLVRGERELAQTVFMEAEHLKQNQHYSKEGEKRIKYATRALLLPPGGGGELL